MIFVTVGSQTPFDRLIRAVDEWAASTPSEVVQAQIGSGTYEPKHMDWTGLLTPTEFRDRVSESEVVVSHAGVGTILTCLELRRPLLALPRQASLGETRNDHQLATAQRFGELGYLLVAKNEAELIERLSSGLDWRASQAEIGEYADDSLISTIRGFIDGD